MSRFRGFVGGTSCGGFGQWLALMPMQRAEGLPIRLRRPRKRCHWTLNVERPRPASCEPTRLCTLEPAAHGIENSQIGMLAAA